jgi:hypothetical protein
MSEPDYCTCLPSVPPGSNKEHAPECHALVIANLQSENKIAREAAAEFKSLYVALSVSLRATDAENKVLREALANLASDLRENAEREGGLFAHFYARVRRALEQGKNEVESSQEQGNG